MIQRNDSSKVINYLEYDFTNQPGETNQDESATISGQTLTVKEVLHKFS